MEFLKLLSVVSDDLFLIDPSHGTVTFRQQIEKIQRIAVDKKSTTLFRLWFQDESIVILFSQERDYLLRVLRWRLSLLKKPYSPNSKMSPPSLRLHTFPILLLAVDNVPIHALVEVGEAAIEIFEESTPADRIQITFQSIQSYDTRELIHIIQTQAIQLRIQSLTQDEKEVLDYLIRGHLSLSRIISWDPKLYSLPFGDLETINDQKGLVPPSPIPKGRSPSRSPLNADIQKSESPPQTGPYTVDPTLAKELSDSFPAPKMTPVTMPIEKEHAEQSCQASLSPPLARRPWESYHSSSSSGSTILEFDEEDASAQMPMEARAVVRDEKLSPVPSDNISHGDDESAPIAQRIESRLGTTSTSQLESDFDLEIEEPVAVIHKHDSEHPVTLSPSYDIVFQTLQKGSWLWKYTKDGSGKPHRRYFLYDVASKTLSWRKKEKGRIERTVVVLSVEEGVTPQPKSRKSHGSKATDPNHFAIHSPDRTLYLIAENPVMLHVWLDGIRSSLGQHV
eukprot:TRINITY_DN6078_c0_g1_i15.p1 TRINITY_DN6078_c0_g1~~TRINITY_DN6078_c0_g1_i15.p1  ORF type:complete len:507 (-),score=84.99 TRINITY_DN6078_c0_g1_i15:288-1808(-)